MDKRTLGGKKKLVFEPKMPEKPLEVEEVFGEKEKKSELWRKEIAPVKETRKDRERANRAPEKPVTLMGGAREKETFVFTTGNAEEITTEDLLRIENSPITVDKIANNLKSRDIAGDGAEKSIKPYQNEKILLQIPNILPEEGQRYIKGKLIIKKEGMYMIVGGRLSETAPVKEFMFKIDPVLTGMPQEGYIIDKDTLKSLGEVRTKFISSVVKKA